MTTQTLVSIFIYANYTADKRIYGSYIPLEGKILLGKTTLEGFRGVELHRRRAVSSERMEACTGEPSSWNLGGSQRPDIIVIPEGPSSNIQIGSNQPLKITERRGACLFPSEN